MNEFSFLYVYKILDITLRDAKNFLNEADMNAGGDSDGDTNDKVLFQSETPAAVVFTQPQLQETQQRPHYRGWGV